MSFVKTLCHALRDKLIMHNYVEEDNKCLLTYKGYGTSPILTIENRNGKLIIKKFYTGIPVFEREIPRDKKVYVIGSDLRYYPRTRETVFKTIDSQILVMEDKDKVIIYVRSI